MRSGPKAILGLVLAGGLVGFGFWAGRGFPRTWQGVFHTQTIASATPAVDVPRVESLENRVTALEQVVVALQAEIRTSRLNPAPASLPLEQGADPTGSASGSPTTAPVGAPAAKIDAHVEFR